MFSEAYKLASVFTRPIVISTRYNNGRCAAGIGCFVVLNREGWALTAWHIIEEVQRQMKAAGEFQQANEERVKIRSENLDKKTKSNRLKALPQIKDDTITNCSAWWSIDGQQVTDAIGIPAVDLALFRLSNFNPDSISVYPVLKNPDKGMDFGRSLCRIGFPFHSITPVFSPDKNAFELPPGSLPLPFFPNDGIFTRVVQVENVSPAPPFALNLIETSSPGLRGQSGGPIFDVRGNVWGIQSRTQHYPLGFSPLVPNGKPGEREHQFLNVGWGVHIGTIVGMLKERSVSCELSDY